MLALFEAAARFTDDLPPGSPRLFLDSLTGQEIAGDTIAEQAVREDCVRVLTAHRSKGLEWDVVVVAGRAGRGLARPAAARLAARRRRARRGGAAGRYRPGRRPGPWRGRRAHRGRRRRRGRARREAAAGRRVERQAAGGIVLYAYRWKASGPDPGQYTFRVVKTGDPLNDAGYSPKVTVIVT